MIVHALHDTARFQPKTHGGHMSCHSTAGTGKLTNDHVVNMVAAPFFNFEVALLYTIREIKHGRNSRLTSISSASTIATVIAPVIGATLALTIGPRRLGSKVVKPRTPPADPRCTKAPRQHEPDVKTQASSSMDALEGFLKRLRRCTSQHMHPLDMQTAGSRLLHARVLQSDGLKIAILSCSSLNHSLAVLAEAADRGLAVLCLCAQKPRTS